jgi:peptide/nickel transport system substrate-binding protein
MRFPQLKPTCCLLLMLLTCACQGPAPRSTENGDAAPRAAGPRGTIKIGWALEPENLNPKMITGSGVGEFMWVFNSFLTYYDFQGNSHPMLAAVVPSRDRGDWVVNADGTMVTTYRLRPSARWHDGAPLTAHDFVFAHQVYMDVDQPIIHREPEPLMTAVEAGDDHTLVIRWKALYVRANQLGYRELNPLPKHLLEEKYRANRANFTVGEEWASAFVGSGPFRVEQWNRGVNMIARAHPDWALGTPKLATLDIRFVSDNSALLANLLSGEIDVTSSPGVRASEAVVARDQWVARGEGYLLTWATRLAFMDFQFREVPGWNRSIADVRVRQGLLHAIDTPNLAEAVTLGLAGPADVFMAPTDAIFPEVDRSIRKYPYDPARAQAVLTDAGWRPGPGGLLAGPGGQTLDMDVMASTSQERPATIVADNWKSVGVNSSLSILAAARERDREHRANFPGAQLNGRSITMDNFHFVSSQIPRAETGYVELNRGSFSDSEIDRLHALTMTSLDEPERNRSIVRLLTRMSELAAYAPLHYQTEVILAKHRVRGPIGNYGPQIGNSWNVHEWEVTD